MQSDTESHMLVKCGMNNQLKMAVFLSRVGLGIMFFYAGITKVLNPSWSAAGYLGSAKTFPELYQWFASAGNLGWVNLVNEWGLTLVGLALISGFFDMAGILDYFRPHSCRLAWSYRFGYRYWGIYYACGALFFFEDYPVVI